MAAALQAFESWSRTSVDTRVSLLLNAASSSATASSSSPPGSPTKSAKTGPKPMRMSPRPSISLSSTLAKPCASPSPPHRSNTPGERDELLYFPLGVGAVIPPWNFPFAIMAGMTAASIVTGNTVILKPSSDSPTIAAKFVEVLEEAGLPGGVVNFCPGSGATFGNAIVQHPKTRFIAFTGSKAWDSTFTSRPPKPAPAKSGSSAPSWKWAAKTPSWSVPTPISTRPSTASSPPPSGTAAKNAPPVPAPSLKLPFTRSFSNASSSASPAHRRRPRGNPSLGPVVNKAALDSILAYIETAKKKAASSTAARQCKLPAAATSSNPP